MPSARRTIDVSGDPSCEAAHGGKIYDESLMVDAKGGLANAFVYIKSGLEGKSFETPTTPPRWTSTVAGSRQGWLAS